MGKTNNKRILLYNLFESNLFCSLFLNKSSRSIKVLNALRQEYTKDKNNKYIISSYLTGNGEFESPEPLLKSPLVFQTSTVFHYRQISQCGSGGSLTPKAFYGSSGFRPGAVNNLLALPFLIINYLFKNFLTFWMGI